MVKCCRRGGADGNEEVEMRSLVLRAQGRDQEAYGQLVRRFQDMAYGYAYALLGDFHLAQDAAQEAFVEAYRCLPGLRNPEAFPGWLRLLGCDVSGGVYGDGDTPWTMNTYNGECNLDSTLQMCLFCCDNTSLVLIQTHNGADVRGGYSHARMYEGETDSLLMVADGYITCAKDRDHTWSTDDTCSWYYQGSCGYGADYFDEGMKRVPELPGPKQCQDIKMVSYEVDKG